MKKRFSTMGLVLGLGVLLASGSVMADGNQIAGAEKGQNMPSGMATTLLSGLDGEDVCSTIVNRSLKNAVIELTLTDDGAGTSTSLILKGKSSALCGMSTEAVSVECLGPKTCAFTWSVDRF